MKRTTKTTTGMVERKPRRSRRGKRNPRPADTKKRCEKQFSDSQAGRAHATRQNN